MDVVFWEADSMTITRKGESRHQLFVATHHSPISARNFLCMIEIVTGQDPSPASGLGAVPTLQLDSS